MDGLLLDGLPGLPQRLQLVRGEQRALVVPDATTARLLADLITGPDKPPPDATIDCSGDIRLVPAEGGLLPHLDVLGNIVHGHTVTHRVTRRAAEEESRETAARCGLGDVLDRYPHEITPGRRRLAGVARALRAHPTAIVLEDAAGLPTWGSLLWFENPELWFPALLLITTDPTRTTGFQHAD
ncbi:hypothetical protein [Kribbella sp. NPDC051718]|uniref:hypothetical protein n=1 Tax=Kribbella sp. NPDC051718 TaxID=3155168 RepID=UPI00344850FE